MEKPTYRDVMTLALPIMASNVSTPLLGLVDTAVLGRVPDPTLLAAVALGATLLTFVFWGFGFLRMGTSGLVAQADGAGDQTRVRLTLMRTLLLATALGLAIIALQAPIRHLAFTYSGGSERARDLAAEYFSIRIWAAPATLCNYGLIGYLVGLGRTRGVLTLQLVLNGCNIAFDAALVLGLNWGVSGVAWGTFAAEYIAVAVGGFMVRATLGPVTGGKVPAGRQLLAQVLHWPAMKRLFVVNSDILLRTLSLIAVFVFFTVQGAHFGDDTLAANAVLLQLVSCSAFFLDGIAFATERLVGHAQGAGRVREFTTAVKRSTACAVAFAAALCILFWLGGKAVVFALTTSPVVRALATEYLPWAVAAPLAGVLSFQLDGVFIGTTRTREMRDAMLVSFGVFLIAWWALRAWGNHGLWAALFVHYAARTLGLGWYLRRRAPTIGAT